MEGEGRDGKGREGRGRGEKEGKGKEMDAPFQIPEYAIEQESK